MTARRVLPPTMPAPASGMDWRHRSACLGEDPELFFPIGVIGPAAKQIEQAKGVCLSCPVQTECLSWALETGQDAGIWGGMTEEERRELRRRPVVTRPRYEVCDECGGPLGPKRYRYCSDACCDSARKRRDATRTHKRQDGAA